MGVTSMSGHGRSKAQFRQLAERAGYVVKTVGMQGTWGFSGACVT